jgi:hypothetical protein
MKQGKDYEKQREEEVRKAKRKEINKKNIRHKMCLVTTYEFFCHKITSCSDKYSPLFKGRGKAVQE